MGQSYLLGCPDGGEAQLREAVERVDAAMCKIRDAGKVKARDRIAVLASLNLAFDLAAQQAAVVAAPAAPVATSAADSVETDAKATSSSRNSIRPWLAMDISLNKAGTKTDEA